MDEPRTRAPAPELARLSEQVRRLAEEKSCLQLTLQMIGRIDSRPGVHAMVDNLLHALVEGIGGTDIRIWYWIESELHHASILGERAVVASIDDADAARVAQSRQFMELPGMAGDSLMRGEVLPAAWTWCFPLLLGEELIGVVKLANVHINGAVLRAYLPVLFAHAAVILSSEIRDYLRQRAQEALRRQAEELERYLSCEFVLFCIADIQGRFLKLSPSWRAVLGHAPEDMQGKPFNEFVHPADEAATMDANSVLADGTAPIRHVNRLRHRDGSWRWIEWDAQRRGDRVFATARDVTAAMAADDAKRLAASVFANSQEGIVITDADNRILDVNEAFTRITGFSRPEVLGRNPKVLRSGLQDGAFYAGMWHALRTEGRWRGEIWNRRRSGVLYAEMLSIDAVRDKAGRLEHYVGVFSDISYIKSHEAELNRIARSDALTGLANRRQFADRLAQAVARSRRNGRPLAVCYLDLDRFKPVNDRYGHEAGDEVLVEVAQRMQAISREGDIAARLGGDEFALLLCDMQREDSWVDVLDRLLPALCAPIALKAARAEVCITASAGVSVFPRDDASAETLLRHADQAMYRARAQGPNRYAVHGA